MKKQLIGICILLVSLITGFLILSCGPGPQDGTQNQNRPQNQIDGNRGESAEIFSSACNDNKPIEQRRKDVEDDITAEFNKPPGRLKDDVKFAVIAAGTNHLKIVLQGRVRFKDDMDDLIRIVRRYLKGKCALSVEFAPEGTLPLKSSTLTGPGFVWGGCEEPKVACPNGECADPNSCGNSNSVVPTPAPNTNTKANTGTNNMANNKP